MSQAESYLQSESTTPVNPAGGPQSRLGSLLDSLNIFGKRR